MDIGIAVSESPFLLVVGVLVAMGLTLWVYRRTIPPVSRSVRFLLVALRFVTLLLVCLALFGSVLEFTFTKPRKARAALLVDTSSSMQIPEDGTTRREILKEILRSGELAALRDRCEVEVFSFSDCLIPVGPLLPDSVGFQGRATNLARALESLRTEKRSAPLDGILLLSDGANNVGENPVGLSKRLDCPIYGVAIGRSTQRADLVLTRVLTNEITYVGNRVPVEVSVRGPGFAGKRISVRLRSEEGVLDQQGTIIPPDGLETSLRLHFTPQEEGVQTVTAEISRLEGELTFENNGRAFGVRVLKRKFNLLLLADAPSPDFTFLKRILLADENVQLEIRTQKTGVGFYEGPFPSGVETESIDLLILLDVPSRATSPIVWNRLTAMILEKKVPFFLVVEKRVDLDKLRVLEKALPFHSLQKGGEGLVLPRLTAEGEIHPVLRIHEEGAENSAAWYRLPPLFSCWESKPKPGCQTLAMAVSEKAVGRSTGRGSPLILVRHVGNEKSLVFLGYGLFRWDLLMWGIGRDNEVLRGFVNNATRWLVTREEAKPFRIAVDRSVYQSGEGVWFSAQVYDETYRPVEKGVVRIVLGSPSGESVFQLTDVGGGQYKGRVRVFEAGSYLAKGEATVHGRLLGRDETRFSVSPYNPEFLDTRAHPELLKVLARVTGGQAGPPDSLAVVVGAMDFPIQSVSSTRVIEFYGLFWILVVVLVLLSVEWFVRKRRGMV